MDLIIITVSPFFASRCRPTLIRPTNVDLCSLYRRRLRPEWLLKAENIRHQFSRNPRSERATIFIPTEHWKLSLVPPFAAESSSTSTNIFISYFISDEQRSPSVLFMEDYD
jgi:hypothetical protein